MGKSSLGVKLKCSRCEAKFYDLSKRSPVCPKCGAVYDTPAKSKSARGGEKTTNVQKEVLPPTEVEKKANSDELEDIDELETTTNDEDDDNLMEDTSDLGEDDDVDSVIGTINDPNKET